MIRTPDAILNAADNIASQAAALTTNAAMLATDMRDTFDAFATPVTPPPVVTAPPIIVTPPPVVVTPPPNTTPPGVTILFREDFERHPIGREISATPDLQHGIGFVSQSYVDASGVVSHSGSRAARFRMGESSAAGNHNSELRIGGLPNLPELFTQFYLYLPDGTDATGTRYAVKGLQNDKWWRVWSGGDAGYSRVPGCEQGMSMWGKRLAPEYMFKPKTGAQWGMGQGDPDDYTYARDVLTDEFLGRWVRVRYHNKVATAANNDGVIRVWFDDQLLLDKRSLHCYPGADTAAVNRFTNAYLFGYANNGYPAGQVAYVDDLVFSIGGFASA